MEVADRIAVLNAGRIEQCGAPREVYERPASEFVMRFLGPVARVGGRLVRPHELDLRLHPVDGAVEAMVARVVHLGAEVRVELAGADGEPLLAQLSRAEADALELVPGDIVWAAAPVAVSA